MENDAQATPAAPSHPLDARVQSLADRLRSGQDALGERLLVLSTGQVPVAGAREGVLGIDRQGVSVLIVALEKGAEASPAALGDHLTTVAGLSERDLADLLGDSLARMRDRHRTLFRLDGESPAALNADQRLIVVVEDEPPAHWWSSARAELGGRLDGVYLARDGAADPLRPPPAADRPGWWARFNSSWGGGAMVILGLVLAFLALTGALDGSREEPVPVVQGLVSTVAVGVPGQATHSQWTGQHRLVQTSDDRLHLLYPSARRLHVVSDRADGGRRWDDPIAVPEIRVTQFAAAAAGDRLLLAYTDDQQLRFTILTLTGTGWEPGDMLVLDPESVSRVVDMVWDPASRLAHVAWADGHRSGQRPVWAAVDPGTTSNGVPRLVQRATLAPSGDLADVLVSLAVTPRGEVVAAYRRADRDGYFSRTVPPVDGQGSFSWDSEDGVPTVASFGAASLAVDGRGVVHLALRDDTDPALVYFLKARGRGWSQEDVAVRAASIEEIDFPTLSLDEGSGLVHLFFQNSLVDPSPQIRVLVRDPVDGWEGSYQVIHPSAVPDGAAYPVAAGAVTGPATVLWTREGPIPEIQIARFIAP